MDIATTSIFPRREEVAARTKSAFLLFGGDLHGALPHSEAASPPAEPDLGKAGMLEHRLLQVFQKHFSDVETDLIQTEVRQCLREIEQALHREFEIRALPYARFLMFRNWITGFGQPQGNLKRVNTKEMLNEKRLEGDRASGNSCMSFLRTEGGATNSKLESLKHRLFGTEVALYNGHSCPGSLAAKLASFTRCESAGGSQNFLRWSFRQCDSETRPADAHANSTNQSSSSNMAVLQECMLHMLREFGTEAMGPRGLVLEQPVTGQQRALANNAGTHVNEEQKIIAPENSVRNLTPAESAFCEQPESGEAFATMTTDFAALLFSQVLQQAQFLLGWEPGLALTRGAFDRQLVEDARRVSAANLSVLRRSRACLEDWMEESYLSPSHGSRPQEKHNEGGASDESVLSAVVAAAGTTTDKTDKIPLDFGFATDISKVTVDQAPSAADVAVHTRDVIRSTAIKILTAELVQVLDERRDHIVVHDSAACLDSSRTAKLTSRVLQRLHALMKTSGIGRQADLNRVPTHQSAGEHLLPEEGPAKRPRTVETVSDDGNEAQKRVLPMDVDGPSSPDAAFNLPGLCTSVDNQRQEQRGTFVSTVPASLPCISADSSLALGALTSGSLQKKGSISAEATSMRKEGSDGHQASARRILSGLAQIFRCSAQPVGAATQENYLNTSGGNIAKTPVFQVHSEQPRPGQYWELASAVSLAFRVAPDYALNEGPFASASEEDIVHQQSFSHFVHGRQNDTFPEAVGAGERKHIPGKTLY